MDYEYRPKRCRFTLGFKDHFNILALLYALKVLLRNDFIFIQRRIINADKIAVLDETRRYVRIKYNIVRTNGFFLYPL